MVAPPPGVLVNIPVGKPQGWGSPANHQERGQPRTKTDHLIGRSTGVAPLPCRGNRSDDTSSSPAAGPAVPFGVCHSSGERCPPHAIALYGFGVESADIPEDLGRECLYVHDCHRVPKVHSLVAEMKSSDLSNIDERCRCELSTSATKSIRDHPYAPYSGYFVLCRNTK